MSPRRDHHRDRGWMDRIGMRAQTLVTDPLALLGPQQARTRAVLEAVLRAWHTIHRDEIPLRAAALAYRTIFSLIPVLVLSLVMLRAFAGTDKLVTELLTRVLDFSGLSEIVLESELRAIEAEGSAEELSGPVVGPGIPLEPGQAAVESQSLATWIQALVERLGTIQFTAIGGVGLVVLIYAALALLVEVEQSFNALYRSGHGRTWVKRVQQYWFLLSLGPLLLFASFWAGDRITATIASIGGGDGSILGSAAAFGVTLSISWLLMLLAYLIVPTASVQIGAAAAGSLVAAVAWEVSKALFREYLQGAAMTTFYGSLALLPLFMLWVYITWVIVLFGLKVAYLLQHRGALTLAGAGRSTGLLDPAGALLVAQSVARAFAQGRAAGAEELTDDLGIPEEAVRPLVSALVSGGVLRRVEGDDEESQRLTLARPAEAIPLVSVLRVGRQAAGDTGASRTGLLRTLRDAETRALEGLTLASTLDGSDEESGAAAAEAAPAVSEEARPAGLSDGTGARDVGKADDKALKLGARASAEPG